jgi:hypothetical protein
MHVVLLGDSVFDNGLYVGGGPDVSQQLESVLPAGSAVSLLAVDGSVTADVAAQCALVPVDCSHLIISSGGNDALGVAQVLEEPANSVGHAASILGDLSGEFRQTYKRLLSVIKAKELPTTVCTIYDGNFPDAGYQRAVTAALAHFNDVIVTEALRAEFDILDLRRIFVEPNDYANPIEPSTRGGEKLAKAIARIVTGSDEPASVRLWGDYSCENAKWPIIRQ